jgi:alpha/beta superfamily hydrolase
MHTMRPVIFDGHFAWLHLAAGTRGVVLCKPPGHEALWLHRSWLALAQELARHGIPTLRFDYRDSGDSLDREPGRAAYETWLDGIAAAAEYLRASTGVTHLSLCGMRLGASLAALCAQRCGADELALIAPVVSGRSYLRELAFMQKLWRERTHAAVLEQPPGDAHTEWLGYRFGRNTAQALAQLDLLTAPLHAPARLLIFQPDNQDASALARRYRAAGTAVEVLPMPDYAAALQPAWRSEVPHASFAQLAVWAAHHGVPATHPQPRGSSHASWPHTPAALDNHEFREHTVAIGPHPLFGMLCEPRCNAAAHPGAPAVLIANTGATSHVGEARFGVSLARHLASRGYASLRVDVAGVGDSVHATAAPSAAAPELEFDTMCADLARAADWLAQQGHAKVVALGVCSGAYLSLHAASAHASIVGVLAINLGDFVHPPGTTLQEIGHREGGAPAAHLRAMLQWRKWSEVWRGQARLAPVLRSLARHAAARVRGALVRASGGRLYPHTPLARAHRMMAQLDQRGVRVRLLYSPLDEGLAALRATFGAPRDTRLGTLRHARACVLAHMDHEVLDRRARADVAQRCEQLLQECRGGCSDATATTAAPRAVPGRGRALG